MTKNHEKLFRALLAAQMALVEHMDEDVSEHVAIDAIDTALKEAQKAAKELRREFSS